MTPKELQQERKAFLKVFQENLARINVTDNSNDDFERALIIAEAMKNENYYSEGVAFSIADLIYWLDTIIMSSQHLSSKLTELKWWVEIHKSSVYPTNIDQQKDT